ITPSSSAKRRKERRTGTTSGACIARGSGQLAEAKLVTPPARARRHPSAPSRTSEPANRLASVIAGRRCALRGPARSRGSAGSARAAPAPGPRWRRRPAADRADPHEVAGKWRDPSERDEARATRGPPAGQERRDPVACEIGQRDALALQPSAEIREQLQMGA